MPLLPRNYEIVVVPSNSKKKPRPIFSIGQIVTMRKDDNRYRVPKDKKLWIVEIRIDPSYKSCEEKSISRRKLDGPISYLLRDGPGEKANDVCWASEKRIIDWVPSDEVNLIDLQEGEDTKQVQEEGDLIEL